MLVDSHCHLEYKGLVDDQAGVLERARAAGGAGEGKASSTGAAAGSRTSRRTWLTPMLWAIRATKVLIAASPR